MKDEIKKKPYDLKERTKQFALRIIRLYSSLPKTELAKVIGKQLLRSGTSVGAQYRESVRSRSNAESISKIESTLQELEESSYWMELIIESEIYSESRMLDLMNESIELNAILTTCVKRLKAKR
jgi:four helix bundle protein